jgi:hypothetical protein
MEKLYNDTQYAEAAIEANEEDKFLYRYQHEVEYEAEVLEWNFVEQEVERQKIDPETGEPMYDEEGNPIMETVTIEVAVPKMVEETYIDPETGEEETIEVQGHHTETFTKMVEELLIAPQFQYLLIDDTNITDGTVNPDYNEADIRKAKFEKEFFLIPAAMKNEDNEDVGVYYRRKPKGYSSAVESFLAALSIVSATGSIGAGIIKVYPVPDFNDPEQVTEEWLVANQISLPAMNAQEFGVLYNRFLQAWNTIEHEG